MRLSWRYGWVGGLRCWWLARWGRFTTPSPSQRWHQLGRHPLPLAAQDFKCETTASWNTELGLPEFSESCRFDRNRCQLDIEVSRGCSRYARESPSKSLSSQDILIAYLFVLFPLTCVINREPWIHGCCILFGICANLLIASMLVWIPRQLLLLNCSSLTKTPQIAIPM